MLRLVLALYRGTIDTYRQHRQLVAPRTKPSQLNQSALRLSESSGPRTTPSTELTLFPPHRISDVQGHINRSTVLRPPIKTGSLGMYSTLFNHLRTMNPHMRCIGAGSQCGERRCAFSEYREQMRTGGFPHTTYRQAIQPSTRKGLRMKIGRTNVGPAIFVSHDPKVFCLRRGLVGTPVECRIASTTYILLLLLASY